MWEIIIAILCVLLGIYVWCSWKYDYWKKNEVPYIEPTFFFGNMKDIILKKRQVTDFYSDFYWKYPNQPAVGIYKFFTPELILRDVDLIKTVFIKEFNSFHDNELDADPKADPISAANPFIAKGDNWKTLRTFHSHAQSSGKIKNMFPLILDVCKDMSQYLQEKEGQPIEAKYFSGLYTTDVVGSSVYGLKTNSFHDPNAEFRTMSSKIFERSSYLDFLILLATAFPSIVKFFKLRLFSKKLFDFFVKVVDDLCEYRKTNNVSRTDFLQTMLDENLNNEKPKFTKEEITAHTMTFFIDGYETSSTLMSFVIYMLGLYPEYQENIRDEINETGQINYENIHNYKYLGAVVNETLRMYPPALILSRVCTKDITLKTDNKSYPITKGMTVALPVYTLHRDPTYFPDPDEFKPERFYDNPPPAAFLPFGLGPRACIGSRFALTQIKCGLAYLIHNFKIYTRDADAKLPTFESYVPMILSPELWVKFEKLK